MFSIKTRMFLFFGWFFGISVSFSLFIWFHIFTVRSRMHLGIRNGIQRRDANEHHYLALHWCHSENCGRQACESAARCPWIHSESPNWAVNDDSNLWCELNGWVQCIFWSFFFYPWVFRIKDVATSSNDPHTIPFFHFARVHCSRRSTITISDKYATSQSVLCIWIDGFHC